MSPQVIAHRTNPKAAPENTVPGILSVPDTGARIVELDVQWSSSGFPVLMHDPTVDRTTNGTGSPATLGLGQLAALSAADYAPWKTSKFGGFLPDGKPRTPVPYGNDFMAAVRDSDLDLLLELCVAPTRLGADKLVTYVRDYHGWQDRTVIMGTADRIRPMRSWYPQLRYVLLEYNPAELIRRGESLRQLGVEGYAVPFRDLSPAAVTYWKSYDLDVYTWTSDTAAIDVPENWRTADDAGADYLITDRPAEAIAELSGLREAL